MVQNCHPGVLATIFSRDIKAMKPDICKETAELLEADPGIYTAD